MGRRGSIPTGEGFMPDTSADELARLAKEEKDARTCKKYMAAYHRKKGMTFKEIGALVFATHIAVRNWLMAMHKGGLGAAPPRKSHGRPRKIPLEIRRKLLVDIHRGPQASGFKANVWSYRDIQRHIKEKYGLDVPYSTVAKTLNEMGVRLRTPRPMHPRAASPEKRLAYQKEARKSVRASAADGFHIAFTDEGQMQGYKNGHKTAGLRGVDVVRTSSVGRARLTVFVAVGYGWVFVMVAGDRANSAEYIKFLDRLCELFGKIHTIDDNAGYRVSHESSDHIGDNADRLRRTATLPYTPNDNAAEPQIRMIKGAMSNVGLDSDAAIRSGLEWCFENGLINPVKFYDYATVAGLRRISPRKAAGIRKRLKPGEHFAYVKTEMPEKEIKLPTIDDLRARDEKILPPEARAKLPDILANSGIPANFLAKLPQVLLAE